MGQLVQSLNCKASKVTSLENWEHRKLGIFSRWRFKWQLRKRKEEGRESTSKCMLTWHGCAEERKQESSKAFVFHKHTVQAVKTRRRWRAAVLTMSTALKTARRHAHCRMACCVTRAKATPCSLGKHCRKHWVHCTCGSEFTSGCCTCRNLLLVPNWGKKKNN